MSNTWLKRQEKRKVTFRIDEDEKEFDLVMTMKEHRRYAQNVKAITGEFQ